MVQCLEFSLDAAATLHINDRKSSDVEDVAGDDDIGAPKEHNAVPIGIRRRLRNHLNAFIVQVQRLLFSAKGFTGPCDCWKRCLPADRWVAHPVIDILGADDRSASAIADGV